LADIFVGSILSFLPFSYTSPRKYFARMFALFFWLINFLWYLPCDMERVLVNQGKPNWFSFKVFGMMFNVVSIFFISISYWNHYLEFPCRLFESDKPFIKDKRTKDQANDD